MEVISTEKEDKRFVVKRVDKSLNAESISKKDKYGMTTLVEENILKEGIIISHLHI